MTTSALTLRRPVHPDRIFFPLMCAVVLLVTWLGFAKTYYAAGMIHAPLPSRIIHIHAIVFTLWLLTLIVQTALVSARKVQVHRRLGLWGFGLASVMLVVGILAATDALRRGMSPPGSGLDAKVFYVVPMTAIAVFAVLIAWAYAARRRPVEHKRLILFATIMLLSAAVGRFPYTITPMGPLAMSLIFLVLPAMVVAYDLVTLKKVHRVSLICFLILAVETIGRIPLGQTPFWIKFATFMQG